LAGPAVPAGPIPAVFPCRAHPGEATAVTLVLAALSWHFVERPILRPGRSWSRPVWPRTKRAFQR
jgi:peptidoglycan/LPS O-acetylase OafA/YrhL